MTDRKPFAVVGGVNVDIGGSPFSPLLMGDSNPGKVTISLGGVGRNIAENLSRIGEEVLFITALGEDDNAARVRDNARELSFDMTQSGVIPNGRTSTYLCLNDLHGDVVCAIADMAIYDCVTPEWIAPRLASLNRSRMVIADANLPAATLSFLAKHLTVPFAADPVSVRKAGRLCGCLPYLYAIKPNRAEAAELLGVPSVTDIPQAAHALQQQGVRNVFLSLGADGVWFDDGTDSGLIPVQPSSVQNTSGCGDAFLAAACACLSEGGSARKAAEIGQKASAICAQSDLAVSPRLSRELLGL